MKAIILGAGMVGSVMAADMAADSDFEVTIADISEKALSEARKRSPRPIATVRADLSDSQAIKNLVEPFDIVLGALSSRLGLAALRAVIDAGRNYCDISFMEEDARQFDLIARERGVTVIVDMGVAPGMSNLLAGHAAAMLSPCENIEIYVGGLPRERRWPYDYKAAFAPADVIEEYTRPSRLVENGRIVTRPALSEPELMDLPGVGTVEAFNTDGLRSIATSLRVPNMKEKTLRYPGHISLMKAMRETGLFSKEPITVGGVSVRPLDVTSALLFPKWMYEPGEADLTVMRVLADGVQAGRRVRMQWDLLDYLDPATNFTSMARTTAFPCTIAARMVAIGKLRRPGVNPPEVFGGDKALVDHMLAELANRGVRYQFSSTNR